MKINDLSYNATGARYGYNGKEQDNEIKGDNNSIDFGARIYDPRVSRFLSQDPYKAIYPGLSSYSFAGNSPIFAKDIDGKYIIITSANPKINHTLQTLYATDLGREILSLFTDDPNNHIYIGTAPHSEFVKSNWSDAKALTKDGFKNQSDNSEVCVVGGSFSDDLFKSHRSSSLFFGIQNAVVLNEKYWNEALTETSDFIYLSEDIFHEIYAHIFQVWYLKIENDHLSKDPIVNEAEHLGYGSYVRFGDKAVMLNKSNYHVAKNSPWDIITNQLMHLNNYEFNSNDTPKKFQPLDSPLAPWTINDQDANGIKDEE